ncbi:MAG: hypothetical protein R2834_07345 [Rhodothermales bacterium]
MGNSALIIVAATVLSGILILTNVQRMSTESQIAQTHMQEDVLARDLALTGSNLVLAEMLSNPSGLSTALTYGTAPVPYNGGSFVVDGYSIGTNNIIDLRVVGIYGDAQYLIHSRYRMRQDLPAMVIDTPNLTITASDSARVNGGPDNKEIWIGTSELERMNAIPELAGLVDLGQMTTEINEQLQNADDGLPGNITEVTIKDDEEALNDELPDIDATQDQSWLQEFYYKTLDKMTLDGTTADAFFPGSMQFGNPNPGGIIDEGDTNPYAFNFGTADNTSIVRIKGDATIRSGASFSGYGILIVEGSLKVEPGAALNWDGIVYLRPTDSYSQTRFDGLVDIRGSLLAYQEAVPPGSHMDVTTHRDLTGVWALPRGTEANQGGIPIAGPWFVHQHKWDTEWTGRSVPSPAPISPDRLVTFLRNGASLPAHEVSLRFAETLDDLASAGVTEIYFKLDHKSQSGMGIMNLVYTDPVTGIQKSRSGSVAAGFDGNGSIVSPVMRPSNLVTLEMQFRSVRMLQLQRDPEGTLSENDGAHRVSNDYDRQGSFHLELYDAATDRLLMTTSVYQHIRDNESEEYEAELDQLRNDIINGHFGLNIVLGPYTTIVQDDQTVTNAMRRFDRAPIAHIGTWTQRCNQVDANCNLVGAP